MRSYRQSIIFSCVARIEIPVCRCSAGSVFRRHAFDPLHCETGRQAPLPIQPRRPFAGHGRSTNRFLRTSGRPDELEFAQVTQKYPSGRNYSFFGQLLLVFYYTLASLEDERRNWSGKNCSSLANSNIFNSRTRKTVKMTNLLDIWRTWNSVCLNSNNFS